MTVQVSTTETITQKQESKELGIFIFYFILFFFWRGMVFEITRMKADEELLEFYVYLSSNREEGDRFNMERWMRIQR